MTSSRAHDTEVDAYTWIKQDLKEKGWDTRNPTRHIEGEVYTQNEVYGHPEIHACLGFGKPENVVKLNATDFWVIEAKKVCQN